MFYYISGTIVLKTETFVVIDASGVGYKLNVSTKTIEALGNIGEEAKLYTYLNFKASADVFDIYGFATVEELKLFEMIIGISRIGAKTAIALLSNISPSKFALCVVTNDYKYISSKTPGLGIKGAERIVLELKDKFKNIDTGDVAADDVIEVYRGGTTEVDEAVSALVVLGYSQAEAKRAVGQAKGSVEELVKIGLKNLMKG